MAPMHLFVHSLRSSRYFQNRPELAAVKDWWRTRSGGVCTLVGIGGSGKSALIDHFLRTLPGALATDGISHEPELPSPETILAYSFDADPTSESLFASLLQAFRLDSVGLGVNTPVALVLSAIGERIAAAPGRQHLIVLDAIERVQVVTGDAENFGTVIDVRISDLLLRIALGQYPGLYVLASSQVPLTGLEAEEPPQFTRIDVGDLSRGDALALLKAQHRKIAPHVFDWIVDVFGGHALSIDFAGAYLEQFGTDEAMAVLGDTSGPSRSQDARRGPAGRTRQRALGGHEQRRSRTFERYRALLERSDPDTLAVLERASILDVAFDDQVFEQVFTDRFMPGDFGTEALLPLTSERIEESLERLVSLGLIREVEDLTFMVHSAVRHATIRNIAATLNAAGHARFRSYLGYRLNQVARDDWGHTSECLDLMEAYVDHSIRAGDAQNAWQFYAGSMGGYVNLGLNRAEYERGSRVCALFVGGAPPFAAERAIDLGPSEGDFWVEWARYSKDSGQIEAAECCLSKTDSALPGRMYGDAAFMESERIELLLLRGRLAEVIERLDAVAERPFDGDSESVLQLQIHRARALASTGRVDEALSLFARLRSEEEHPFAGLLNDARLQEIRLLNRTGRATESIDLTNEVVDLVYDDVGTWNTTLVPYWDLWLGEAALADDDFQSSLNLLRRARAHALSRGNRRLLCRAAVAGAEWAQAQARLAGENDETANHEAIWSTVRIVSDAVDVARQSGLGLDFIDLLLARARLVLLLGWSTDARRDAEIALNEGIEANPTLHQAEMLSAAHPRCGYVWGIAEAHQIIAEATLLDVAQMLDARSLEDVSPLSSEVALKLADARSALADARAARETLGDSRLEHTTETLERLESGYLSDYPLRPIDPRPAARESGPRVDDDSYDVFISYHSTDRSAARSVAQALRSAGARVWLDERVLRAGSSWQTALANILESVPVALILVGADGLGRWQQLEIEKLLIEQHRRTMAIVPVRLPGMAATDALPGFLATFHAIDLSGGFGEDAAARLALVWQKAGCSGGAPD